jgi:hypothetical protein
MAIKSALDLAMERLAKQSGAAPKKMSAEQKAKLAELDKVYTAKIADLEITRQPKITETRFYGDLETAKKLEDELRAEIQKLRKELEEKKEAVRKVS